MASTAILVTGVLVVAASPLPDSYLLRAELAVTLCRGDIDAMISPAETAAARLVEGGRLWAAGERSMVSELCGRAGGFMLIKELGKDTPGKGDVVLYVPEQGGGVPASITESGALVIVFGKETSGANVVSFPNHADEAGISPTLANAIPGWLFTGELIAALTRMGKMPVIYESIGIYGGYPRIYNFLNKGILYHEDHRVEPVAPGKIANAYVDTIRAILRRVEAEDREKIDKVGQWAAEARKSGKRTIMYSMGHLFPDEVGETAIAELFESDVWNSGFFQHEPPKTEYSEGDLCVHIGYQHPPYRLLERARPAGARVAYVDILQHRDYVKDDGVIWIDPMWPWVDACVPLDNYDVPLLASSGVVNGAIAWEIYRVSVKAIGSE